LAHTKQKSTLLRKVWALFVFPAFWVDFKNMNDLGPLGLRANSFSLIFGSYQTKVHFAAQSLGSFCFPGFLGGFQKHE
jgi:hypothetical protein